MNSAALATVKPKCRHCGCLLNAERPHDDFAGKTCTDCKKHPASSAPPALAVPRPFNAAEKSLIRRVHAFMPAGQLLGVLNERLLADVGPEVAPHTMEQLHAQIREVAEPAAAGDWAGLRKLRAQARRDGVLDKITAQTIDDFAVVFSLTPAQVLRVKDVILSAEGAP